MKVRLVSGSHFSAAHRLHREDWDDEKNRRVFDKCSNPNGHGHTYQLEVTVEGEIDPETGYVMDFSDLKRAVEENVIRKVDRRHLNFDVDFLSGLIPTAENIAVAFWRQLESKVAPARLLRVALNETEKNRVVYEGDKR
ncbi:MAG TPA: 6-carboxytetrahydropterin synthase [Thermoanaerobaculia bacterium]|nr:6-carboxytetrahydropterin synthase [Thermoanaerobaculia bacterium]